MNLVIDQGNSSVKIAVFDNEILCNVFSYKELTINLVKEVFNNYPIHSSILCAVTDVDSSVKEILMKLSSHFIELDHFTLLPIANHYGTPETLGKDRIAAAVGANYLMPAKNLLVIDMGTAITYDFVSANNEYLGGNISPGIDIRFRALHEFTGKLPLVEPQIPASEYGKNTVEAINAGVIQGIVFEIEGYITLFRQKCPDLSVFLTGRGSIRFVATLKKPIFAEINLVLIGLNRILTYNAQQ
jgi:type III pantothenate kinase